MFSVYPDVDHDLEPCETCGPAYNQLELDYEDNGKWSLRETRGCYGGGSFEGTRGELIEHLKENFLDDAWYHKNDIEDAIWWLENA